MKLNTFVRPVENGFLIVIRDEENSQENVVTMTLTPTEFANFVIGRQCEHVEVDIKTKYIGKKKKIKLVWMLYPNNLTTPKDIEEYIKQNFSNEDGWEFSRLFVIDLPSNIPSYCRVDYFIKRYEDV